jgi:hypothetical protein
MIWVLIAFVWGLAIGFVLGKYPAKVEEGFQSLCQKIKSRFGKKSSS